MRCLSLPEETVAASQADLYLTSTVLNRGHFVLARAGLAFIMDVIFLWSVVTQPVKNLPMSKWFIYLTHWTLTVEVLYLNLAAYATWMHSKVSGEKSPVSKRMISAVGILHATVLPATFLVFTLFWTLVYDPSKPPQALTLMVHGMNFVVMATNFSISKHPYVWRHGVYILIYGLSYLFFSLFYYLAGEHIYWFSEMLVPKHFISHNPLSTRTTGGENEYGNDYIYSAIKWDNLGSTIPLSIGTLKLCRVDHLKS
jgi:hypothetical protein